MPVQHPYRRVLNRIFGGELKHGAHNPDGQGCFLEVATIARLPYQEAADIEFRARHWSDSPRAAGLPDARGINDAAEWSSDVARTRALTPVAIALWDWATWPRERKDRWLWIVAKRTWAEVVVPSIQQADLPPEQKDLWLHFGEEPLPDRRSEEWYDLVQQAMPKWSAWSQSNQRWGFEALADRLPMFARIFTGTRDTPPMDEADLASVAARCSDILQSDKPLRKACLIWAEAAEQSADG